MDEHKERKLTMLKQAHGAIASGTRRFICLALYDYASEYDHEHVYPLLQQYVLSSLAGHETYESWVLSTHKRLMRERGVNDVHDLFDRFTAECRRARLAWIDHMINLVKNDEL